MIRPQETGTVDTHLLLELEVNLILFFQPHKFSSNSLAILSEIQNLQSPLWALDLAALIERVASILEDTMGGTIGARTSFRSLVNGVVLTLYSVFGIYLNAYSNALSLASSATELNAAPLKALDNLSQHTTAKPGDRTVIDALHPFCHTLATSGSLDQAVARSMEGAEATVGMKPRLGRAVYVGKTEATFNTPDPGAWGVARLLQGLVNGLVKEVTTKEGGAYN